MTKDNIKKRVSELSGYMTGKGSYPEEVFKGQAKLDYCNIRYETRPFMHNGSVICYPFNIRDMINQNVMFLIPKKLGIYHLFKGNELVYIGMSNSIRKRLTNHVNDDVIDFDNAWYFFAHNHNLSLSDIRGLEKNMIQRHKPKFNVAYL